ncbi:MAG: FAD-dependent oxidoreductase, partial [Paracoccaceae bacterium]
MTDVLIIGAGPAGLAAAERLAASGARVTVLERQGEPGGTPRLCGHSPFGMREFHRVLRGGTYAARLAGTAMVAGAAICTRHHVIGIAQDLTVSAVTPDGPVTFTPRAIILATGVREASRAERLLPGDRPLGVMTTGALQDLWFARHALPFRRPIIYGRELVAMSAILTCREMGAKPVAVIAPTAEPIAALPFRWLPLALRLPVLCGQLTDLRAKDGRLVEV